MVRFEDDEELRVAAPRTRAGAAVRGWSRPPPREVVEFARDLLTEHGDTPRLLACEPLKKSVCRLRFEVPAGRASVVVKRLSRRLAEASRRAAQRWLPAVGLERARPDLLGVLREPGGSRLWHIYEDVGGIGLDYRLPDPGRVGTVVELIVDLHARFAGHRLLAECRRHGADLGMGFFTREVARSVGFLSAIGSCGLRLSREQAALRDRLLGRLELLEGEGAERGLLLEALGGPDTLLHGDLWTTNTLVAEENGRLEARLVDWDHVGVGPVTYDLSTFLYRFAPEHRPWILGQYREAAARRGRRLPDDSTLNQLFATAEYARYACCLAEAALAASRAEGWAFEQMAEIDTWFAALEPALAVDGGR